VREADGHGPAQDALSVEALDGGHSLPAALKINISESQRMARARAHDRLGRDESIAAPEYLPQELI
jgi:hypothetical protein